LKKKLCLFRYKEVKYNYLAI